MRDKILKKFGFDNMSLPRVQRVLVLLKSSFGFTTNGRSSTWSSICEDVTSLMTTLDSSVIVECFVPSGDNNQALVYAMQKATVIISEDGTVSLNSLFFGREGGVHVIRGRNINPTFWSAHVKYFYFEKIEELATLVPFALKTAAKDLGIGDKI